mmetsp:Transcript_10821/g.9549  ORF Transcript_10821/g.9549 Transcript_10821/m.9549 type:complete len:192 (+) Transcript_10821:211-786(+)
MIPSTISILKKNSKEFLQKQLHRAQNKIKKRKKTKSRLSKHKTKILKPSSPKLHMHMHKRVDFKNSATKDSLQTSSIQTHLKDKTSLQNSQSNEILYSKLESYKKYTPLISALPKNLPNAPTIAERIRAAKRLHMTRRDLTEQKIIRNILMHNDPGDIQNFEVLYVTNKQDRAKEDYKSRNQLPSIHHATQ